MHFVQLTWPRSVNLSAPECGPDLRSLRLPRRPLPSRPNHPCRCKWSLSTAKILMNLDGEEMKKEAQNEAGTFSKNEQTAKSGNHCRRLGSIAASSLTYLFQKTKSSKNQHPACFRAPRSCRSSLPRAVHPRQPLSRTDWVDGAFHEGAFQRELRADSGAWWFLRNCFVVLSSSSSSQKARVPF